MYRYLLKTVGCSKREVELKVMEIYNAINNQRRLQEVIDILQDMAPDEGDDFVFGSQKDAEEFTKCYMETHNHSHVHVAAAKSIRIAAAKDKASTPLYPIRYPARF